MTTSITVQTGDHAAKVVLSGGNQEPTEHLLGGGERRDFHVYDDLSVTVTEVKDDDPSN